MFFAVILACSVIDTDRCVFLKDTRGPYDTIQECQSRVQDILANSKIKDAITSALKAPTLFAGTCNKAKSNGYNI